MAKIQYKLLDNSVESAAYINQTIKSGFKKRESLRGEIQKALVAIAYHAWKHNDWTLIYKLATPSGKVDNGKDGINPHDGNSKICKWACKYIGLEIVKVKDEKGKDVLKFGNWKGRDYIEENFNTTSTKLGAKDCMWFGFKESELKAWDVNAAIRALSNTYAAKLKAAASPDYDQEHKTKIKLDINKEVLAAFLQISGVPVDEKGNIVFEVPHANKDVTVG